MASTFTQLLSAAQTALTSALGVSPTVVLRKKLRKRKSDTLPMVVVSGVASHPEDYDSEGYTYKIYEVQVAVLYSGNQILNSNFSLPDTLETVEKALNTSALAGVSYVYDTDVIENPLYDASRLDDDVEVGVMQINYYTYEPKN